MASRARSWPTGRPLRRTQAAAAGPWASPAASAMCSGARVGSARKRSHSALGTWRASRMSLIGVSTPRSICRFGLASLHAMHRKWWTLIAVCTATFMLLLDITVVNVALPDIQDDLDASFSELQWVVDAYALMLAALLLTAGVLGDLLGRRRVFGVGFALFT